MESARTPGEHLRAAECLVLKGEWDAAEQHFRVARASEETVEAATVGHARALFHLNQPYDAMLELDEFLRKRPDSAPALQVLATLHAVVADDTTVSLELMERCARLAPGDSAVWQHLGNLYLVKRRDEEALKCFERAVELTPRDPQALASLGYFYGKFEKVEQSQQRFDEALKLASRAAEPALIWLTYGKALQEQRNWQKSKAAFTEALKLDPHSSEGYFGRAVASEKLKDFAEANADALAAIKEFPVPRKDAYLLLVRVSKALNDTATAEGYAKELARIDAEEARQKEESRILRDLLFQAEPLFTRGQFPEAAAVYEELVGRAPKFYEAYFALGMCYAHTNQLPRAADAFRKYLALQPLSADGHASLGIVLLQLNQPGEAKPELQRTLELDPGMLEARQALAGAHLASREFSAALDLLMNAPNPEADRTESFYFLLVHSAAAAGRRDDALRFCQAGTRRFPASDRVKGVCDHLK